MIYHASMFYKPMKQPAVIRRRGSKELPLHVSNVATDLLDAADKHMPTLGLNARRKFFHLLAICMFVPGIAYDVSGSVFPTTFTIKINLLP